MSDPRPSSYLTFRGPPRFHQLTVMALLQNNPRALERPILIVDGQAVIGRPPENVLALLKSD